MRMAKMTWKEKFEIFDKFMRIVLYVGAILILLKIFKVW